MNANSNRLT